jgi:hypothetical protein
VNLKRSGILTGTAGVYFVASQLAAKGFHAAITFGNAPNVDILVGSPDGAATLSLQVKTSMHATRAKGKGGKKKWHHYEWYLGIKSAGLNQPGLFFAFVSLKGMDKEMPDVFIVPSMFVHDRFERDVKAKPSMLRWHPLIETFEPFKNNWDSLREYLNDDALTNHGSGAMK